MPTKKDSRLVAASPYVSTSTGGGDRTLTTRRSLDFESGLAAFALYWICRTLGWQPLAWQRDVANRRWACMASVLALHVQYCVRFVSSSSWADSLGLPLSSPVGGGGRPRLRCFKAAATCRPLHLFLRRQDGVDPSVWPDIVQGAGMGALVSTHANLFSANSGVPAAPNRRR